MKRKLLIVAGLACLPALAFGDVLFSSDMDTSTGWVIRDQADTSWQFGWDFTTMGVPPSPGGSTTGLKMQANLTVGSPAYIWAVTEQSFSGQYVVEFDFWANSVGPFPGGGSGSTEYIGGGVGRADPSYARSGAALYITGEGGNSVGDWRLYKDTGLQYIPSGQYDIDTFNVPESTDLASYFPGQEPPQFQQDNYPGVQTGAVHSGAPAFAWRHMVITVDGAAGTANFAVDGHSIGTLDTNIGSPVAVEGPAQLFYADPFSSLGSDELLFGVFDNFVVTPEPTSLVLLALGGLALLRRR